jgi:DNA-directed RNA polymerase, sigma subunit (sigma70/sigma32)
MRSLSEVLGGDGEEFTLEDTIASDEDLEGDAVREADTAAMKHELWVAVDSLSGDLPEVIKRRYIDGQTLKSIGSDLELKYERVRQMEYKALRALRQPGRSRKYHKYYEEYISAESYRHVGVESFMRTGLSEVELEVLGWIH